MLKPIVGLISMIVGLLLLLLGVLGVVTFGTNGTLQATSSSLKTEKDAYALVADVLGISTGLPGSSALGQTTVGAKSTNSERLFIGVGPRDAVDEYLFGVPFDAVRQDGSRWQTQSVPGTEKPADPLKQDFWTRRSTGNAPTIDFATTSSGAATFAIMNADGTPDVQAQMTIGFTSKLAFPLSIAAIVLGLLGLIGGVWMWRRSRRDPDTNRDQATTSDPETETAATSDAATGADPVTDFPAELERPR